MTNNDTSPIPRRIDRSRHVHAERCITDAMAAVEIMPADPRLTDAVVLLGQARDSVADFVDGLPRNTSSVLTTSDVDKLREACGGSQPSDGHSLVDEVCGLLRVARGQRDAAEKRANNVEHNVEREAAIQQMREALEGAYSHTFNSHCSGDKENEHEAIHQEILEACCAADRVGIVIGNAKPAEDARVLRIAEIIQDGMNHEMGSQTIARAIHAALRKSP